MHHAQTYKRTEGRTLKRFPFFFSKNVIEFSGFHLEYRKLEMNKQMKERTKERKKVKMANKKYNNFF